MTAGARPPDRSPPLARRVAAGLVDLLLVWLVTAATAFGVSTRVAAIRQPDGSITFSDADRDLLNRMTGPLSQGRMLGDTLWAFSTDDVVTVIIAAIGAGIVVGVLVPSLAGGSSPGKLLFRLRILTVDGRPPGILRHLVRTVLSPVDLMPLVVPGLTGYAFAASNPDQQRIGDRLAGTIVVVDQNFTDDLVPVADAIDTGVRRPETDPPRLVPTIRSATLLVHASGRAHTSLNTRPKAPDLNGDEDTRPHRADVETGVTAVGPDGGAPEPQPNGDTVDMNERDSASEQSTPESTDVPVPVEERSTNPYPKPVRRTRAVAVEPELPDFESLTLPESSLSDMPLTNNALFEALGLAPPVAASGDASDPPERADEAPLTASDPPERADEARLTASDPPERAGEAPLTVSASTVAPTTSARRSSSPAADRRAPIWSEDWEAWIYWDTTLENWFRHDMQRDTWVPMEEN